MDCISLEPGFELATLKDISETWSSIVPDDAMLFIQISLTIIIKSCVSLGGAISNLFNIVIFLKLGLKDSMSVGLFSLSLADFLLTILQLGNSMCYLANIVDPNNDISLWSIGYFIFGWAINAVYRVSCCITAMISIERCLCVASPFIVKKIFTKCRCVMAILAIWILHIGLYIPMYVSHKIGWTLRMMLSADINSTESIKVFTVSFDRKTAYFEIIFDITIGVVWLLLSHAVVTVCAIWMGYSLRSSTQIRQNISLKRQSQGDIKPASNLTVRERRLLKVVLLVAIILTTCNIPRYITTTVYHTLPGMNTGGQANLSTLLWTVTAIFSTFGCSMNFFVYITVNSKYRQMIYKCHPISGKDKEKQAEWVDSLTIV